MIDEIAPDFKLWDVWELPVQGGRDEFSDLVEIVGSFDPASDGPLAVRTLFWVRLRLGELFGWDDPTKERPIPGSDDSSLAARLPEDLRDGRGDAALGGGLRESAGGFRTLYETDDEWAAEVSNDTVHGVLHLAWVEEGGGRYRGHMGIYVKPRGKLGEIYLAFINPFRHLIVYPALMREIERAWDARPLLGGSGFS